MKAQAIDFAQHRAFERQAKENRLAWRGLSRKVMSGSFEPTEARLKALLCLFQEAFEASEANPYVAEPKAADREALARAAELGALAGLGLSRPSPDGRSLMEAFAELAGPQALRLAEGGLCPWEDWPDARKACDKLIPGAGLAQAAGHLMREARGLWPAEQHRERLALAKAVGLFAKLPVKGGEARAAMDREAASILAMDLRAMAKAGLDEMSVERIQAILELSMPQKSAKKWTDAIALKIKEAREDDSQRQAWREAAEMAVREDAHRLLAGLIAIKDLAENAEGIFELAVRQRSMKCAKTLAEERLWGQANFGAQLHTRPTALDALVELAIAGDLMGEEWLAAACLDGARGAVAHGASPKDASTWIASCLAPRSRSRKASEAASLREKIMLDVGLRLEEEFDPAGRASPSQATGQSMRL